MLDKAGAGLAKAGKASAEVVKDRHFQLGVLTALPMTLSAFFLVRKYQRQAEEKETLYKKALVKHNAVIRELDAKAEMDKERQDWLLDLIFNATYQKPTAPKFDAKKVYTFDYKPPVSMVAEDPAPCGAKKKE